MPRFAILGSCVTRDAFDVSNAAGEVALYLARSSLPVVCSTPVAVPQSLVTHEIDHEWHRTTYARFFTKSYLDELERARPDALILDLIDDRFDYHVGDTILPGIDAFLEILRPDERGRPVDFMAEPGFEVWLDGARRFFAAIRTVLPGCPILLHRARWAGEDAYAELNNLLLDRKFAAIAALDQAIVSLEVEPQLVVADEAHRWGRQPFHYVRPYYSSFNDRLSRVLR